MRTTTRMMAHRSCATRISAQLTKLTEIVHEFYSPLGWYLGMVATDGRLVRFSELFPSQDSARHVLDLLLEAGVQQEDFVPIEDAQGQCCDFGVTGFARCTPTQYVAVGLTLSARMRVLRLDRERVQLDLDLPIIRTAVRLVQWCRSVMVWKPQRVVVGMMV